MCSLVQEASDNIAQEKKVIYVVLILLGQHGIGKNLLCNVVKEVPDNVAKDSWDNIAQVDTLCNVVLEAQDTNTPKNSVQCCLNTLGTTLHR